MFFSELQFSHPYILNIFAFCNRLTLVYPVLLYLTCNEEKMTSRERASKRARSRERERDDNDDGDGTDRNRQTDRQKNR